MVEGNAKPGFGWELQGTANVVANDVGVTDEESVAVGGLRWIGAVEVRPETCFDSSAVREELLKRRNDEL